MIPISFVPKVLLEILKHIPTVASKTVDWGPLLARSKPLFSRWNQSNPDPVALIKLSDALKDLSVQVLNSPPPGERIQKHPLTSPQDARTLLQIYFAQLLNSDICFLDLSSSHFYKTIDGKVNWRPNGLWIEWDPQFRISLLELYECFYGEGNLSSHPETIISFEKALRDLKLVHDPEPQSQESKALMDLMQKCFVPLTPSSQFFKMKDFQDSFLKLFEHFIRYKIRLRPDFIFLGFYLTSLYQHLETIGQPLETKQIWMELKKS